MKNLFGLIGFPLSHSFSKKYFSEKFEKENIVDSIYDNFELPKIEDLEKVFSENTNLKGLNVTIPYKEQVFPYLNEIDPAAKEIGAINVIKISNGKKTGYNSDYYGFKKSLELFLNNDLDLKALVLGTGGASKAVIVALKNMGIPFQYVSRNSSEIAISYDDITNELISEYRLIVNTTPLGMTPNTETCPPLPYSAMGSGHYLYDLVYNPETTLFMKKGMEHGAKAKSGLDMLHFQAEKAWEIWNS